MRKVQICGKGYFNGANGFEPSDFNEGYCHGIFSEGDNENGLFLHGIIELSDGTLKSVPTNQIKFLTYYDYEKLNK